MEKIIEIQETIYKSKNPTRRYLHQERKKRIVRYLENFSDKNLDIAEIGPGSGVYIPWMNKFYKNIVLYDLETKHLKNLKKKFRHYSNIEFLNQDITKKNNNKRKFSIILCTEVLEHVENPELFFKSLCKMLKKDGILIFSTPQPYSFIELTAKLFLNKYFITIIRKIYNEPVLETGHISLCSENKLKKWFLENNLYTIDENYFGLYIPFIAEFFNHTGNRILIRLEKLLKRIKVRLFFWTQLYVLKKL